ncbi:MAG: exo-beta-N-acetylmuramidase NamZ family protein [Bacteroidota bacterium]
MIQTANYNFIGKLIPLCGLFFMILVNACVGQQNSPIPAAYQTEEYLPFLKGKSVGMVVNQTSTIEQTHLVDTLRSHEINIKKVFAPEHGFRGDADAGATVKSGTDQKTGLPIISLYGKNKKPTKEQLQDLDLIIFDIQDVGARFYTYISTMHYVMEACAENDIPLMILDRPNPNGMYVDGPVLEMEHQSFVGMHPIPILHGLTVAELAQMINGEKWLKDDLQCELKIIKNKNYSHSDSYSLPIKPSPNLPNDLSIALYPSLCLFEGTVISVGRGTEKPFQQIGHPALTDFEHTFTPVSMPGSSVHPPFEDEKCYGIDFESKDFEEGISLKYLIDFYKRFPDKDEYFNSFLTKLAGTESLRQQIEAGFSEEEIKMSWQAGLEGYKEMRVKYLIYKD